MFDISLVVLEDDDDAIELYMDMLSSIENITIKTFTNPREGLDYILKNKPNIVITDLVMPHMDGFYVIQKIKESYNPKILLISSIELDIIDYNHDYFLTKPIDLLKLKEIVETMKKGVCTTKGLKLNKLIKKMLEEIGCMGRDRLFMEDIIKLLVCDAIEPSNKSMYDVLSQKMRKDKSTIKRKTGRIIDKIYEPELFNKVLGIKKKPKPKEFIDAVLDQTYKKAKDDVRHP